MFVKIPAMTPAPEPPLSREELAPLLGGPYPALDEMFRLGLPLTRAVYLRMIWAEPEGPPAGPLDAELEASLPPPFRRFGN